MPRVPGVTVDEARLAAVCARYGIARLRVFGSVARGTATPDSDIDVLYELEPGRRLGWEIEQLADELALGPRYLGRQIGSGKDEPSVVQADGVLQPVCVW